MSNRGSSSITLGDLQGKLTMLEVACHRCERRGRVSLARLIEEHGADKGLPDLWESLAGAPTARIGSGLAISYFEGLAWLSSEIWPAMEALSFPRSRDPGS